MLDYCHIETKQARGELGIYWFPNCESVCRNQQFTLRVLILLPISIPGYPHFPLVCL